MFNNIFNLTDSGSNNNSGSYTVKSGDDCYHIANKQCQKDPNNWPNYCTTKENCPQICNADKICGPNLQLGEKIFYDCSGSQANCPPPTPLPSVTPAPTPKIIKRKATVRNREGCGSVIARMCPENRRPNKSFLNTKLIAVRSYCLVDKNNKDARRNGFASTCDEIKKMEQDEALRQYKDSKQSEDETCFMTDGEYKGTLKNCVTRENEGIRAKCQVSAGDPTLWPQIGDKVLYECYEETQP